MSLLQHTHAPAIPPLFHNPGLVYFWFLNDDCAPETINRHINAYAQAGIAAVSLHARHGLTIPYGSQDWFNLIHDITRKCHQRNIQVWLYDEDPFPSGNAGGRILMEHPEYRGHAIELDIASAENTQDHNFIFPAGKLLWCGVVDENDNAVHDLTAQVGVIRRTWNVLDPWDSKWYYPATPLYPCPRSMASNPELAVRLPQGSLASLPQGHRLVAFTARPCAQSSLWGGLVDTLNPDATALFLKETHDRYTQSVGQYFGSTITAMFTDEPKFHSQYPHTPGLLEAFQQEYNYDLAPRLIHLFTDNDSETAILTRLHYRQFCAQRFIDAWMKPNADWCHAHGLSFVGHISPEDDPVEQSSGIGNLFPLQKYFDLTGLDLIIPAVGDNRHKLINIGPVTALSCQQQLGKPGVMSEMLGASGTEITPQTARRIIHWQTVMGVTSPVIHGGFNSMADLRRIEAPPDSGPDSPIWNDMIDIADSVAELQSVIRQSTNIAPVAILWPIRSFNMNKPGWQAEPGGMRGDLADLLALCLDRQIGVHLLDEQDFHHATFSLTDTNTPQAHVGRAAYQSILIPSSTILHEKTFTQLRLATQQGIKVIFTGQLPTLAHAGNALHPAKLDGFTVLPPDNAVAQLPRLIDLQGDATDIRCTAWHKDGQTQLLIMNLRTQPYDLILEDESVTLEPDDVLICDASSDDEDDHVHDENCQHHHH